MPRCSQVSRRPLRPADPTFEPLPAAAVGSLGVGGPHAAAIHPTARVCGLRATERRRVGSVVVQQELVLLHEVVVALGDEVLVGRGHRLLAGHVGERDESFLGEQSIGGCLASSVDRLELMTRRGACARARC